MQESPIKQYKSYRAPLRESLKTFANDFMDGKYNTTDQDRVRESVRFGLKGRISYAWDNADQDRWVKRLWKDLSIAFNCLDEHSFPKRDVPPDQVDDGSYPHSDLYPELFPFDKLDASASGMTERTGAYSLQLQKGKRQNDFVIIVSSETVAAAYERSIDPTERIQFVIQERKLVNSTANRRALWQKVHFIKYDSEADTYVTQGLPALTDLIYYNFVKKDTANYVNQLLNLIRNICRISPHCKEFKRLRKETLSNCAGKKSEVLELTGAKSDGAQAAASPVSGSYGQMDAQLSESSVQPRSADDSSRPAFAVKDEFTSSKGKGELVGNKADRSPTSTGERLQHGTSPSAAVSHQLDGNAELGTASIAPPSAHPPGPKH